MLRMEEEMKADCLLLFLSHLFPITSFPCFESKAWLLTTFPCLKGLPGCRTLLLPSQKNQSGFRWVFYYLPSNSQAFIYTRTTWRHTIQFRIRFSLCGCWKLSSPELQWPGSPVAQGTLLAIPDPAGRSICYASGLQVSSPSRWILVQSLSRLLLLFLLWPQETQCFTAVMPVVSGSTSLLRKALRQIAHSRCFDIVLSKTAFYLESEKVVWSWEISQSRPHFPHLSDEAIMVPTPEGSYKDSLPIKHRAQC